MPVKRKEVELMKRLVEFPLQDGGSVLVEVEEPEEEEGGIVRVAREGEVAVKAPQAFETALDKMKPITSAIISKLRDLAPDRIQVELGVKMSTEAGVVIASAAAEANFKVTLTWEHKETDNKKRSAA
jgi:hypothetical protein